MKGIRLQCLKITVSKYLEVYYAGKEKVGKPLPYRSYLYILHCKKRTNKKFLNPFRYGI
jgi:hypothetical protein